MAYSCNAINCLRGLCDFINMKDFSEIVYTSGVFFFFNSWNCKLRQDLMSLMHQKIK